MLYLKLVYCVLTDTGVWGL